MTPKNLEEAKGIIEEFPDQDDFVNRHYKQFMNAGEPDDNSIELAHYWADCKRMVDEDNSTYVKRTTK